jgi:hypothetical protein
MMPKTVRHADVERRAYELYEQRGREDGRDWDDWLQAEREMLGVDTQDEPVSAAAPLTSPRRRKAEREAEYA